MVIYNVRTYFFKLLDVSSFNIILYFYQRTRKDKIDWQCSTRPKIDPCRATVMQKGDVFKAGPSTHNHAGAPGIDVAVKIKSQVHILVK